MNDAELRQRVDVLRVLLTQRRWQAVIAAANAIAKEAESRRQVKCQDCNYDWGHGYCGVCKGRGWVLAPEEPETNEDTTLLGTSYPRVIDVDTLPTDSSNGSEAAACTDS